MVDHWLNSYHEKIYLTGYDSILYSKTQTKIVICKKYRFKFKIGQSLGIGC